MKNLLEYTAQANAADGLIWKREILIPCVLHKVNRINSTIMLLLFNEATRLKGRKISEKDKVVIEISQMANIVFSNISLGTVENIGAVAEACHYKFVQAVDKGEFMPIHVSCVRSNKLIDEAFAFIDRIFIDETDEAEIERKNQLKDIVELWWHIRDDFLYSRHYLSDDEIQQFQDAADEMQEMFIHLFGRKKITFYLNDMFAGIDRLFLQRYRSLYAYSNVGAEAYVGVLRSICDRRTNGGHTGKGGKGGIVDTIFNWNARRIGRALDLVGFNNGVFENPCQQENIFVNEMRLESNAELRNERKRRKLSQVEIDGDALLDEEINGSGLITVNI